MKTAKRFFLFFALMIVFFACGDVYAKEEYFKDSAGCVYEYKDIENKGFLWFNKKVDETITIEVYKYEGERLEVNILADHGTVLSHKFATGSFIDKNGNLTCPSSMPLYTATHENGDRAYFIGNDRAGLIASVEGKYTSENFIQETKTYDGSLNLQKTVISGKQADEDLTDKVIQDVNDSKNGCLALQRESIDTLKEIITNHNYYLNELSPYFNEDGQVTGDLSKALSIWTSANNYRVKQHPILEQLDENWNKYKKDKKCNTYEELTDALNLDDELYQKTNAILEAFKQNRDQFDFTDQQLGILEDNANKYKPNYSYTPNYVGNAEVGCDLIDSKIWAEIRKVLSWIQIGVPILILLLGSVDFGKAVLSEDQDALKKATSKFVKRCIIGVAIFLVPIFLDVLFKYVDFPEVQGSLCKDDLGL